jgi:excinuclease UvrABC ATPase subunit
MRNLRHITVSGARIHNLKNIDVTITEAFVIPSVTG